MSPIIAVAATIADEVPIATLIGTPQANTIKGVLNEPPPLPTMLMTTAKTKMDNPKMITFYSYPFHAKWHI